MPLANLAPRTSRHLAVFPLGLIWTGLAEASIKLPVGQILSTLDRMISTVRMYNDDGPHVTVDPFSSLIGAFALVRMVPSQSPGKDFENVALGASVAAEVPLMKTSMEAGQLFLMVY